MLGEFLANGQHSYQPALQPIQNHSQRVLLADERQNRKQTYAEDTAGGDLGFTRPDQDGLKFKASGGENLAENTIKIDGVPYIAVGDAKS